MSEIILLIPQKGLTVHTIHPFGQISPFLAIMTAEMYAITYTEGFRSYTDEQNSL